jgi:hypothetical protein
LGTSHALVTGFPHPFQFLAQLRTDQGACAIELLRQVVDLLMALVLNPLIFGDVIQPRYCHRKYNWIVEELIGRK